MMITGNSGDEEEDIRSSEGSEICGRLVFHVNRVAGDREVAVVGTAMASPTTPDAKQTGDFVESPQGDVSDAFQEASDQLNDAADLMSPLLANMKAFDDLMRSITKVSVFRTAATVV